MRCSNQRATSRAFRGAIGTAGILFPIKLITSLRVSAEDESEGLDPSRHGEAVGADG